MSYIALYRKYRPLTFDEVVSQEAVVTILRNSVISGRIAHAYLFSGTRGTGKTTLAHVFARAINCPSPDNGNPCNKCEICSGILSGSILDVLEIDAASNNSVDNIREIREQVIYAPANSKYKVYIIDEVHMLSTGAFNALLKTLEEPPSHVVFILATTEPHKIPATILSRCQRFDFGRIPHSHITGRINDIAQKCGADADKAALEMIASLSDGAMRDAISILDQCIGSVNGRLTLNDVLNITGLVNFSFMDELAAALCEKNIRKVMEMVNILISQGKDLRQFASDLTQYYRNILLCTVMDDVTGIIHAPEESLGNLRMLAAKLSHSEITFSLKELSLLDSEIRKTPNPRILLELTLVKICLNIADASSDTLEERLSCLERKLAALHSSPLSSASVNSALADSSISGSTSAYSSSEQFFMPDESTDSILHDSNSAAIQKHRQIRDQKPSQQPDRNQDQDQKPSQQPDRNQDSNKKFVNIKEWDSIVESIKQNGKMALYSQLAGTSCVFTDEKTAEIRFPKQNALSKMLVSRHENIELLTKELVMATGKAVCIRLSDSEESVKTDAKKPFRQNIIEISEKLNIPVSIIDNEQDEQED